MAPVGCLTRTFSTNPVAYAVPAGRYAPIVLDVANSVMAGAKIAIAREEGRAVPEGAIYDRDGRPTGDPTQFGGDTGLMAPLGVPLAPHKGIGLAMVVDAPAGVLTGGAFGRDSDDAEGKTSRLFWAIDPEAFMPRAEFLARVDAQIEQVKAGARMPGVDKPFYPGERSRRRLEALRAAGQIPLGRYAWEGVASGCREFGVLAPPEVG